MIKSAPRRCWSPDQQPAQQYHKRLSLLRLGEGRCRRQRDEDHAGHNTYHSHPDLLFVRMLPLGVANERTNNHPHLYDKSAYVAAL